MTPCQKLGYNVGDKFVVIVDNPTGFAKGSIATLYEDDGSDLPLFKLIHGECLYNHCNEEPGGYASLENVEKI